jgi:hypothetical protein
MLQTNQYMHCIGLEYDICLTGSYALNFKVKNAICKTKRQLSYLKR